MTVLNTKMKLEAQKAIVSSNLLVFDSKLLSAVTRINFFLSKKFTFSLVLFWFVAGAVLWTPCVALLLFVPQNNHMASLVYGIALHIVMATMALIFFVIVYAKLLQLKMRDDYFIFKGMLVNIICLAIGIVIGLGYLGTILCIWLLNSEQVGYILFFCQLVFDVTCVALVLVDFSVYVQIY